MITYQFRLFPTLKQRVYQCDCGLKINRDKNAALNILRLGLQSLGLKSVKAPI